MTKPISLPTANFVKRNVWTLPSGELCARGGMVQTFLTEETGRCCFSVPNPRTGETWQYIVEQEEGDTATIRVYDQDNNLFQEYDTQSTTLVEVVTCAVVEDQILITSPSFASAWSYVGDGLVLAEKQDSAIPDREVLDIPRGLSVGWASRAVVATRTGLYISDALKPRTFDPVNVLDPPGGEISGVHVSAGGALVIATTEGVWALPEDAASSADVYGVWSQLTSERFTHYNGTCTFQGQVYGLTENGFRRVDVAGSPEVLCAEKSTATYDPTWTPLGITDFRTCRIYGGLHGPVVTGGGKMLMTNISKNLMSWWSPPDNLGEDFDVRGLMQETDGTQLFLFGTGVWRNGGSKEYSILAGTGVDVPPARLYGQPETRPVMSNVVRWVDFSTDAAAGMMVSVPGSTYTFASLPQVSIVLGTDEWGATYQDPRLRSRRANFAQRLDEVDVLVRVQGPLSRLGSTVDVGTAGPGKNRRTG